MYFAVLEVDDKFISKVSLDFDEGENAFIGREWVSLDSGINFCVLIGTDAELMIELKLQNEVTNQGKPLLKASETDERYYFWANLVQGKGNTQGLTVGLKDNQPKDINIPDTWVRDK